MWISMVIQRYSTTCTIEVNVKYDDNPYKNNKQSKVKIFSSGLPWNIVDFLCIHVYLKAFCFHMYMYIVDYRIGEPIKETNKQDISK